MNTRYIRCAKCGKADLPTKAEPGTAFTMRCPDCCERIALTPGELARGVKLNSPYATMCRECCPTAHGTHAATPTPATPLPQSAAVHTYSLAEVRDGTGWPEGVRFIAVQPGVAGPATWEERVQALEVEGLTRSDAQAVVDAEDAKAALLCECGSPLGADGKCHWHGCDKSVPR